VNLNGIGDPMTREKVKKVRENLKSKLPYSLTSRPFPMLTHYLTISLLNSNFNDVNDAYVLNT
jgi:hypothetical protein